MFKQLVSCDYGEIVPHSCTAVVFHPENGARMLLPQHQYTHPASKGEMALAAFFKKLDDEEWIDNLIEEVFGDVE